MSCPSLLWITRSTSRTHLIRYLLCSQWPTVFVRRSLASDNSKVRPFQSLLNNKNVRNPFEDPSRSKKKKTGEAPLFQKSQHTITGTNLKNSVLSELEGLKKLGDETLRKTDGSEKRVLAEEQTSTTINKNKKLNNIYDTKSSSQDVSLLGGTPITGNGSGKAVKWKSLSERLGLKVDENATEAERKRQKMTRNTTIGCVIMFTSCAVGFIAYCFYYGRAKRDAEGNYVKDEFSGSLLAPLYRIAKSFREWRDYVTEPSREVLLPNPLPQHLQPKYTLVIEMKHILVAPEWTYKAGHRFKKRPALDYFLEMVGYPNFEVVIYTSEGPMTAPQIVDSFDPKQRIMYRLYRDCTKYMKGNYVKDLSRLNRDLSKVIYIDFDPQAFQLNPENVLRLPKWDGDMDDTSLVDLAELLKTIYLSNVEDVRPTLQYYSQFDNPLKEFRQRAIRLAEQERLQKERQAEGDSSVLKRYSGRLFGYRRHA